MHEEILSGKQIDILPLISKFADNFCLIGGTAIALQLGHRRSIDFDLLTTDLLNNEQIRKTVRSKNKIEGVAVNEPEELTLIVDGLKLTFLQYPFNIDTSISFKGIIKMPDILTLAAMKAFALGRRAKWKDYVDIYFISKQKSFKEIVKKAKEIFGNEFSEKLFREQLSYFEDINYSESVNYMPGFEVPDKEIKESLKEVSLLK